MVVTSYESRVMSQELTPEQRVAGVHTEGTKCGKFKSLLDEAVGVGFPSDWTNSSYINGAIKSIASGAGSPNLASYLEGSYWDDMTEHSVPGSRSDSNRGALAGQTIIRGFVEECRRKRVLGEDNE